MIRLPGGLRSTPESRQKPPQVVRFSPAIEYIQPSASEDHTNADPVEHIEDVHLENLSLQNTEVDDYEDSDPPPELLCGTREPSPIPPEVYRAYFVPNNKPEKTPALIEKAFRAILRKPTTPFGEISEKTGIPAAMLQEIVQNSTATVALSAAQIRYEQKVAQFNAEQAWLPPELRERYSPLRTTNLDRVIHIGSKDKTLAPQESESSDSSADSDSE